MATSRSHDEGFTLVEVMVALMITMVVAIGLLSMDVIATKTTENYGHLSARATEYAQDKMEQLLVLSFGNALSDTRVFPAATTGGTGLLQGGSWDPSAPVDGYVDYLTQAGNLVASVGGVAPPDWYYIRTWRVDNLTATLKQITVTVAVRRGFGNGQAQQSTVTALKSLPF